MKQTLDQIFKLQDNHTTIKKEFLAGFTTFITMAYIIFVNPQMMASSGMDIGASFVGTCIAAALACFAMGFYSNWPIGLAPGMGLNAFFTYTVVGEMGYPWEVALGAVFIAGILFVIISITPLRRWMLDSIPLNLRIAMGAGVGLFVGFIGLKTGGIIIQNEATFLSLGNLKNIETLLAAIGFLLILILAIRKITGAIIIGVLTITILGLMFTGCSDDDSTTAAADCTTLMSNLATAETNWDTDQNIANCDALTSAGSAFLSGGCIYCDTDAEACLEDESNVDTCCDEPTQDDLDELTAICVSLDDGSIDGTGDIIKSLTLLDSSIKLLVLSRNFGHQAALQAGGCGAGAGHPRGGAGARAQGRRGGRRPRPGQEGGCGRRDGHARPGLRDGRRALGRPAGGAEGRAGGGGRPPGGRSA